MIEANNTHWIFVCGINQDISPQRHLMDIDFGVRTLELWGCNILSDISILVDFHHDYISKKVQNLDLYFENKIFIKPISQFGEEVLTKQHLKNIAVIVLGHGGHNGISSESPLKPNDIVNSLARRKFTESLFVVYGQCYGGVYNYLNLDSILSQSCEHYCFCGAAKFTPSFSYALKITGNENKIISWTANYFITMLFMWLSTGCCDLDGDKKSTLLDAFKFMSLNNGDEHTDRQIKSFSEINSLYIQSANINPTSFEGMLKITTIKEKIKSFAEVACITPEPWIMNWEKSSEIEFLANSRV